MKNKNRIFIISFLIILASALCSVFSITAQAAGSAEFYIPDGAVSVGEEFEVSVVFTGDQNIGWVDANFTYDDSAVKFVSSDSASGGSGILTIKGFPEAESKNLKITLRFTALKKGTCEMALSNCAVFGQDQSRIASPTAYALITVAEGEESSGMDSDESSDSETVTSAPDSENEPPDSQTSSTVETGEDGYPVKGVLKKLTVSEGELVPAFSPDIYDYVVKVGSEVEYCEIEGTTASITDYIWYTGSNYLAVGDNFRTITVTDDTGAEKVYNINIQRSPEIIAESEPEQTVTKTVTSAKSPSEPSSIIDDDESALDQYKSILIPALCIVMFVLVLALVIITVWLRKKSQERKIEKRRSKIQSSRRK